MDKQALRQLLLRYVAGKATPEELHFLEEYCRYWDTRPEALKDLAEDDLKIFEKEVLGRIHQHMDNDGIQETVTHRWWGRRWPGVAAAIACLLLLAAGWLWYKGNGGKEREGAPAIALQYKNDIAPGGNKALLTLANGSTVVLDSVHTGMLATQGNSKIVKTGNGILTYNSSAALPPLHTVQYNTLTTPRGGQYQLVLPDGSKVWLNAASALRYPTTFTGANREVEMITGEAYFEVAQNKDMPFVVKSGNTAVQVLGTSFNINAYPDEAVMKVTLLEGAVKVEQQSTHATQLLLPDQQAQINDEGQIRLVNNINVKEAISWKNGLFLFNNTDIHEVMQQLSRWYDTEVAYNGNIDAGLSGIISRNTQLSEVLRMLGLTREIHFKIEGKKIVVTE